MKGLLIVLSGFSGVGKGTIVKEMLKRYPEKFALSISATTRKPREGEVDGREYFFKEREEFEQMIENGDLLEYCEYNGNYYGTPKDYVLKRMEEGVNVILEIEVVGGLQVRQKFPGTFLLYIVPPSVDELFRRLTGRGTETPEVIMNRMKRAVDECDYIDSYDEIVVNDDLNECIEYVNKLIMDKMAESESKYTMIEGLRNDLIELTKGE